MPKQQVFCKGSDMDMCIGVATGILLTFWDGAGDGKKDCSMGFGAGSISISIF